MFDGLMNRGDVHSQARAAALAMFAVQGLNCKDVCYVYKFKIVLLVFTTALRIYTFC